MLEIHPMESNELDAVASIHAQAFPNFLMTILGHQFLKKYYALVLRDNKSLALVAKEQEKVVGFVVGYLDPPHFYRTLAEHKISLVMAAISGIMFYPGRWRKLFHAWRSYRGTRQVFTIVSTYTGNASVAELASIAVAPFNLGQGIGKRLVLAFCQEAFKTTSIVYLTTNADHNEYVNRFYHGLGFKLFKEFEKTSGRNMNIYILERGEA